MNNLTQPARAVMFAALAAVATAGVAVGTMAPSFLTRKMPSCQ